MRRVLICKERIVKESILINFLMRRNNTSFCRISKLWQKLKLTKSNRRLLNIIFNLLLPLRILLLRLLKIRWYYLPIRYLLMSLQRQFHIRTIPLPKPLNPVLPCLSSCIVLILLLSPLYLRQLTLFRQSLNVLNFENFCLFICFWKLKNSQPVKHFSLILRMLLLSEYRICFEQLVVLKLVILENPISRICWRKNSVPLFFSDLALLNKVVYGDLRVSEEIVLWFFDEDFISGAGGVSKGWEVDGSGERLRHVKVILVNALLGQVFNLCMSTF